MRGRCGGLVQAWRGVGGRGNASEQEREEEQSPAGDECKALQAGVEWGEGSAELRECRAHFGDQEQESDAYRGTEDVARGCPAPGDARGSVAALEVDSLYNDRNANCEKRPDFE